MKNISRLTQNVGIEISRYGLVLILLWYGIFKFTNAEAQAILDLIENSPLFSWMLSFMTIQQVSNMIGTVEIITAIAIAARPFSPWASVVGSFVGIVTFVATLSFLATTPGMFKLVDGMYVPNGFILKDLLLLGFSVWSFGESYAALEQKQSKVVDTKYQFS
ncbi:MULTISPECIES: DUF417 family protein [Flammeovirga]|uniref:DUF417 family protein n=1 Tax=Flammeovirga agarivorans TaxID=2726742 RepID=A0A7X8XUV0_9BACT|nr:MULTISPECIES: DUF417 family protein [Flammeovirga]NLR90440.1 DUF417 family protein [Flammeovirga agarivorans]